MGRRLNKTNKIQKGIQKFKNFKLKSNNRRYSKQIHKAKQYVKNLSTYNLTDSDILLLSKGVKFIPKPSAKNLHRNLLKDFDELARKMRCTYLFDNGTPYIKHPFYTNTGYNPTTSNNAIESYIFATKFELSKIKTKTTGQNLTPDEYNSLKQLRQNKDIVIKKADKNSTLCILNRKS